MSAKIYVFKKPLKDGEEETPHISGNARCVSCGYQCQNVAPIGSISNMECPECKCWTMVFMTLVYPDQLQTVWHCECKNDLFFILADHSVQCCRCGLTQLGGDSPYDDPDQGMAI